jgi:dTDP-4-dehydrorhamnose reductase
MPLLLTGAGGQVGVEIVRLAAARGLPLHALTRAELDIADGEAVAQAVRRARPDGVINAAAYTAVDRAEAEPEAAFAVNRDGAAHLAAACAAAGIPLVHLSTDYVFDGTKGAPYTPDDPVAPLGVYGRSKADGEAAVRAALREHVIVRTAWVFSAHGHNFVRTMARLMQERDEVRVVADQFGHPTWAGDLARIALDLAGRAVAQTAPWGTLHAAGQPLTSWHGFAEAIHASLGDRARATRVEPIPTEAYPTPARRPVRVELDMGALALAGLDLPDWRPALDAVVAEIVGRA